MGLKFKDKISIGEPQPGDVAERELQLDLKDKSIYSSTNGTDLVRISQPEVVGKKWDIASEYQTGDLVTYPKAFVGGFVIDEFFVATTDNNIGNNPTTDVTHWQDARIVRYLHTDHEITIGGHGAAAGDFDNLETCLLYLGRFVAVDGAQLTIKLLSGHVLDYTIYVPNITLPAGLVVVAETGVVIDLTPLTGIATVRFMFNNVTSFRFYGITFTFRGATSHPAATWLFVFRGNIDLDACPMDFAGATSTSNLVACRINTYSNAGILCGGKKFGYVTLNTSLHKAHISGQIAASTKAVSAYQGTKDCTINESTIGSVSLSGSVFAVYVYQFGMLKIVASDLRTDGTAGGIKIQIESGSIVYGHGGASVVGNCNLAPNVLVANGVYFH